MIGYLKLNIVKCKDSKYIQSLVLYYSTYKNSRFYESAFFFIFFSLSYLGHLHIYIFMLTSSYRKRCIHDRLKIIFPGKNHCSNKTTAFFQYLQTPLPDIYHKFKKYTKINLRHLIPKCLHQLLSYSILGIHNILLSQPLHPIR